MTTPTRYFFTARGMARLEGRIADAREAYRAICSTNPEAREAGDSSVWHDNFAFEENQRQMHQWGRRIRDLEDIRARAEVVAPAPRPSRAAVGTRVRYRFEDEPAERVCFLAGWDDGDPSARRVSYNSPLGVALVGAAPDEEREVVLAGRTRVLLVVDVTAGEDQ